MILPAIMIGVLLGSVPVARAYLCVHLMRPCDSEGDKGKCGEDKVLLEASMIQGRYLGKYRNAASYRLKTQKTQDFGQSSPSSRNRQLLHKPILKASAPAYGYAYK